MTSKLFFVAVLLLFVISNLLYARAKYLLPCSSILLEESRKVLFEQIGTLERTNRNDGQKVKLYLKSIGLEEGNPYCLAGQYYCFWESSRRLNFDLASLPFPRTGLATRLFNYSKQVGKVSKFLPNVDDIIVWQKGKTPFGHVERIINVGSKGWVETIGFNTRRYDRIRKRYIEGVFRWHRNLFAPLGHLCLIGIVGFYRI